MMSEDERCKHRIPASACRPVISRAHHLTHGAITESDWERLRNTGERIWLFDPTPPRRPTNRLQRTSEETFDRGVQSTGLQGAFSNALVRTPMPTGVHGFMSGMSSWGPWVVFREMAHLPARRIHFMSSDSWAPRRGMPKRHGQCGCSQHAHKKTTSNRSSLRRRPVEVRTRRYFGAVDRETAGQSWSVCRVQASSSAIAKGQGVRVAGDCRSMVPARAALTLSATNGSVESFVELNTTGCAERSEE